MEEFESENRIRDLEERLNREEEKNKETKESLDELIRRSNEHLHSGYDESSKLRSSIELDPGSQFSIAGSGFANLTQNEGTSSEINFTLITAGNDAGGGVNANTSGNSQITLQHAVAVAGNTFLYAFRPPLYQNVGTTITNGTNTLTDGYFNWTTNELAGAYVNIVSGTTGLLQETGVIASNTADTITITGTWTATTASHYIYTVWRTVYCGAANHPWERFYAGTDIRFGVGVSNKRADGIATTFAMTKESDTALSIGAGFGSLASTSTLGADFTITALTSYHQLEAAAARTSSVSTAINDGSFTGQLLTVQGLSDSNTITIKDNANTALAGDVVLGAKDTLTLIWDGSDWVELSRSNNA